MNKYPVVPSMGLTRTANRKNIDAAIAAVADGKIVGFPTDTVYGIGVRLGDPQALERLNASKRRPQQKKIAKLFGTVEHAMPHLSKASETAKKLARIFWPGPLTLVVPSSSTATEGLDGDWVGVRVSAHPVFRALVENDRVPENGLYATSANISNNAPARSVDAFEADFADSVDITLDVGELSNRFPPSNVVRVDGHKIETLRPGPIPEPMLLTAARPSALFVSARNGLANVARTISREYEARLGVDSGRALHFLSATTPTDASVKFLRIINDEKDGFSIKGAHSDFEEYEWLIRFVDHIIALDEPAIHFISNSRLRHDRRVIFNPIKTDDNRRHAFQIVSESIEALLQKLIPHTL